MRPNRFEVIMFLAGVVVLTLGFAVGAADSTAEPEAPAVVIDPAEPPAKPADEPMSPEERQAACSAAINTALKKYDCVLHVAMLVTQAGNEPIVQIFPNEAEKQR